MARNRSKSWYISRLVRASGDIRDDVINVQAGTADSDVSVIAQLRREADSDTAVIQSLSTTVATIASFADSDLKVVADLRNDVDSDGIKIKEVQNSIPDSDFVFSAVKIKAQKNYWIQPTQPTITENGQYWYNTDSEVLYKSSPSASLTTLMPSYSLGSGTPYNKQYDYATGYSSSVVRTDISGTDALGGSFSSGTNAEAWFRFASSLHLQALNAGAYYDFTVPQDLRGIIIENSDPAAGTLTTINYTNGDYYNLGTWYNSGGSPLGKTANPNTTGNTFIDISHPTGVLATRVGFRQVTEYYSGNDVFLFFAGNAIWKKVGPGFDSDQIVSIINENVVSGSVDSDVAAIAQLRRDADSDSIRIQEIATSLEQINELVDSDLKAIADLRNDVDSDSIKLQALQETVSNITSFDSDQVVTIINENLTDAGTKRFDYLAVAGDSEFTGSDINGNTLSYTPGTISVYVNGILLNPNNDFTATTGTSVNLSVAADSDDDVTIIRSIGVRESLDIQRFDFTAVSAQTSFTGNDDNGNSLGYVAGKIQVFLNGLLLKDTLDYTATNGTSVTLITAADSDDVLTVLNYFGSEVLTGFDSDQVVAIINENLPVDQTGFDSDQVVAIINENASAGFDSDQVIAIIGENSSGGDYTIVTNSGASGPIHYTSDTTSTGGIGNMKLGFEAGKLITSNNDQYNVYLGYRAGYRMGGDNNIGIGRNTMYGSSSGPTSNIGFGNIAIGGGLGADFTTAQQNIVMGSDAGIITQAFNVLIGHGIGYITKLTANNGANVFIGQNINPAYTNAYKQFAIGHGITSKGNYTFFLGGSSGVYNEPNSSTWNTTSDSRIKTNVTDYTTGLTILDQVNVKTYNYLSDSDIATAHPELADSDGRVHEGLDTTKTVVGLMAQDLEALLPNSVTTRDNGIKSVNKDELFWVMLNSIKELKALNEALTARVETLENN